MIMEWGKNFTYNILLIVVTKDTNPWEEKEEEEEKNERPSVSSRKTPPVVKLWIYQRY
jgi:hypothetical protein